MYTFYSAILSLLPLRFQWLLNCLLYAPKTDLEKETPLRIQMQAAYVFCFASLSLWVLWFLAWAVNEASGTWPRKVTQAQGFTVSIHLENCGLLKPQMRTDAVRSACWHAPLSLISCHMDERRPFLASSGNIDYASEESHANVFDMHLGGKKQFIQNSYKSGLYV